MTRISNRLAGLLSRAPSKDQLNLPRGEGPEVFYPYDHKEVAAIFLAVFVFGVAPLGVTFLLIGYLLFCG